MGGEFDAVIIGSGFGGSVMAYRLASAGFNVCILERGRFYPPGTFPRTPADISRCVWDPKNGYHGLYQLWSFKGLDAIVSAGVGGGSLIYANVLKRMPEAWFESWPVSRADLDPHYTEVEKFLGANPYPYDSQPYSGTAKTQVMQFVGRAQWHRRGVQRTPTWSLPDLAITFAAKPGGTAAPGQLIVDAGGNPQPNRYNKPRFTCQLTGECDFGCNYGAKNTLDYNYLTLAEQNGAQIFDRCSVRWFRRTPSGFTITYRDHRVEADNGKARSCTSIVKEMTADTLILAAGSLGSTHLLLRSMPGISKALGTRFNGNGDLLGFAHHPLQRTDMNPMFGPVITSLIEFPDALDGLNDARAGRDSPLHDRGFLIEEGGFPHFAGWALEASDYAGWLRRAVSLATRIVHEGLTGSTHPNISGEVRRLLGNGDDSSGTLVLLGMGRELPNGRLKIARGRLALDWSSRASHAYYHQVRTTMERIAKLLDARFSIDPLWNFRRRVITAHPLGGCPMGTSAATSVVDPYGQAHNCAGLYVTDGSVLPGPAGANPSLTIAALADRFAEDMISKRSRKRGGGTRR